MKCNCGWALEPRHDYLVAPCRCAEFVTFFTGPRFPFGDIDHGEPDIGSYPARIYRTQRGYRILATGINPSNMLFGLRYLGEMGVSRNYLKLCQYHGKYSSRVSPKRNYELGLASVFEAQHGVITKEWIPVIAAFEKALEDHSQTYVSEDAPQTPQNSQTEGHSECSCRPSA